jgi:hypothetical protein
VIKMVIKMVIKTNLRGESGVRYYQPKPKKLNNYNKMG